MTTVAIIDYGMGNLRSVAKAIEHVAPGHEVFITSDPARVAAAERVVFPGQGAMPDCMRELDARNLRQAVLDAARNKPFLGICIGQQMLFEHSEEGDVKCLGIFPEKVKRFKPEPAQEFVTKVPHMGWNNLKNVKTPLFTDDLNGEYVYFVHSYFVEVGNDTAAICNYINPFSAALQRDNFYATQFHPEKSGTIGAKILENFLKL